MLNIIRKCSSMNYEFKSVFIMLLCCFMVLVSLTPDVAYAESENIMNGETIVIEAEDTLYSNSSQPFYTGSASGKYVLNVAGSGITSASNMNINPSCIASFTVNKSSMYAIWIYANVSSSCTLLYDLNGDGNIKSIDLSSSSIYKWYRLTNNTMYTPGYKEIHLTPSNNIYIDKVIITSDLNYVPTDAASVPNATFKSSYFTVEPVEIFPEKNVHPRLYITKEDIPQIKQKLKDGFFADDWTNIVANANMDIDSLLPESSASYGNYSSYTDILLHRAFMYALGEVDATHADKTVKEMMNFISTVKFDKNDITFDSRNMGSTMVMAACVYDWCYDRLSDADKTYIIQCLKKIASHTTVGYPAVNRSYVVSLGLESHIYKDQLAVAIAVYDEDPDWYNHVTSIIFNKLLPTKNFFNSSGWDTSGSDYGGGRNKGAVTAEYMFRALGYEGSIFADNYTDVLYTHLYNRLPDGVWFKDGDDSSWDTHKPDTRANPASYNWILNYLGNNYNDPYLARQGLLNYAWRDRSRNKLESAHELNEILNIDLTTEVKEITELPLTHFTKYPISSMTARTSWQNGLNAPTAMVNVNMREVTVGDHQHADIGGFQLYYKGMLALNSGLYRYSTDHYNNYQRRSIAHNVVLVKDPDENFGKYVNDGGQKIIDLFGNARQDFNNVQQSINSGECITAKDTVYYSGPDTYRPEFSYISSDISSAYSDKINEYKRSAVFVNTENENYPALFIVYDNLQSSNAQFKKTWLLHSEEEPQFADGNKVVITRTTNGHNGKLVNKTLVPSADNTELIKIGGEGKEFWVGDEETGKNYPVSSNDGTVPDMGNWRVELSPVTPSLDDAFLNAMYVTDADSNLPELPISSDETDLLYGVYALDKAVYFAKSRESISTQFSFTLPENGFENTDCFIAGCSQGKWRITGNNTNIVVEIGANNNSFALELPSGTYTVVPVSSDTQVTPLPLKTSEKENFGDFIIRRNNNLMYLPKPTKIIDGIQYVAIDGLFTQLGAQITQKTDTAVTFSVGTNVITVTADTNVYTLNATETKTAKYNIKMIDGEIYASLNDFSSYLGITDIRYYDKAKLLEFAQ